MERNETELVGITRGNYLMGIKSYQVIPRGLGWRLACRNVVAISCSISKPTTGRTNTNGVLSGSGQPEAHNRPKGLVLSEVLNPRYPSPNKGTSG